MKQAIMITMDSASNPNLKEAFDDAMKAISLFQKGSNHGVSVRVSCFNPTFSEDLNGNLGKFVNWFMKELNEVTSNWKPNYDLPRQTNEPDQEEKWDWKKDLKKGIGEIWRGDGKKPSDRRELS